VLNSAGDAAGVFVARRDFLRRDDVAIVGRTGFNLDRAFVPVEPINGVPFGHVSVVDCSAGCPVRSA
jgi:hypothetical protein